MTHVIIYLDSHAAFFIKDLTFFLQASSKPFIRKSLLQKWSFNFVIYLPEIHFEDTSIQFIRVDFIQGFMKNDHTLQDGSARHEIRLSPPHHTMRNPNKAICTNFCENLETHIKQTIDRNCSIRTVSSFFRNNVIIPKFR